MAERAELVELLRSLTPAQWDSPSLCDGWSVRDVAGHLTIDSVPLYRYALAGVVHPSADRLNEHYVVAARDAPVDRLVDRLSASTSHSWTHDTFLACASPIILCTSRTSAGRWGFHERSTPTGSGSCSITRIRSPDPDAISENSGSSRPTWSGNAATGPSYKVPGRHSRWRW